MNNIQNLLYLTPLFELITAILATVYFHKYKNSTERYFLYFLWGVVFVELTGLILWKVLETNNNWIYILYIFISFLFYFYWFYSILKKTKHKKILIFFVIIFIAYSFYNFFTLKWNTFQSPTFICGALINLILSLFYFSELLNSNDVLNIKHKLSFWITTGLLLFNVGMIPFMAFSSQMKSNYSLWVVILVSLNAILYTCYSLGFIWSKKSMNY